MPPSPASAPIQAGASEKFPCSLFSLAEIKAATGYDVVAVGDPAQVIVAVGYPAQRSCEYVDAHQHSFGVEAQKRGAAAALKIFSQIEGTGAPVRGIGDSAFGNHSELAVVCADDHVQVSEDSDAGDDPVTLATVGLEKLKEMAIPVHAAM